MRTQAALYEEIDLELSWSEAELPERERTKHVHRLHPYLGKYVPQLVEVFLRRYARARRARVGSLRRLGDDPRRGERLRRARGRLRHLGLQLPSRAREDGRVRAGGAARRTPSGSPRLECKTRSRASSRRTCESWFAPRALAELLAFRDRIEGTAYPDLWRVVLSRAARSARLARHFDLDFPAEPVQGEYFCHKHRRTCRPVEEAGKFLRRYVRDAVSRVLAFAEVRRSSEATVLHGDARALDPPGPVDLVVTSPPYPGLIDYHEQHVYAFELLGLERRDAEEIGRGVAGYCEAVAEILGRARGALAPGGQVVVVVNDRRGLYEGILAAAGLRLEERSARHVNRRTGRRNGEYFEDVLVAVRARRRVRPRA